MSWKPDGNEYQLLLCICQRDQGTWSTYYLLRQPPWSSSAINEERWRRVLCGCFHALKRIVLYNPRRPSSQMMPHLQPFLPTGCLPGSLHACLSVMSEGWALQAGFQSPPPTPPHPAPQSPWFLASVSVSITVVSIDWVLWTDFMLINFWITLLLVCSHLPWTWDLPPYGMAEKEINAVSVHSHHQEVHHLFAQSYMYTFSQGSLLKIFFPGQEILIMARCTNIYFIELQHHLANPQITPGIWIEGMWTLTT